MKKSLLIALGAIALGACTKTAVDYEQTGEIGFAPVVRVNGTKAAVSGSDFPATWDIKVFGYYDNSVATGESYSEGKFTEQYLPGVDFAKKNNYWLGKKHSYYWPKTGSILFAAYAPADYNAAIVSHDEASNEFSVSELAQPTFDQTVDLLYSPYTTSVLNATVSMAFSHAFSWVTIQAKADAKISIKIKNVTLKGMVEKGEAKSLPTWTTSGSKDFSVFSSENGTAVPTDFDEFADNKECVIMIPQTLSENAVLEIAYSMDRGDGTFVDQKPFTAVLNTIQSESKEIKNWEAGKHYFYNIIFGAANEIEIAPSVKAWEIVTSDNINATKGGGEKENN